SRSACMTAASRNASLVAAADADVKSVARRIRVVPRAAPTGAMEATSVPRVAIARLEHTDRAAHDEVERVGHERVHAVLDRAELDDRALGGGQVDRLGSPATGVAADQLDAFLGDRVEDRTDDVERAVDARPGVEHENAYTAAARDFERVVLVLVG